MSTIEMSQGGAGAGVPSPDEVFEMFERGEFDPRPESEAEAELPLLTVLHEGVVDWAQNRAQALREAGRRGTWEGRHDVRGRHSDREKPSFVGKYAGKCVVTPRLLEVEYGASDPQALV